MDFCRDHFKGTLAHRGVLYIYIYFGQMEEAALVPPQLCTPFRPGGYGAVVLPYALLVQYV
jgi:hypothetical protein